MLTFQNSVVHAQPGDQMGLGKNPFLIKKQKKSIFNL